MSDQRIDQRIEDVFQEMRDEIVEALGVKYGQVEDSERTKDLYRRCIAAKLARLGNKAPDIRTLKTFHNLVRNSIKPIQDGWPSARKAEVRKTLTSLRTPESIHEDDPIDTAHKDESDLANKAIDVALCLWLGVDCADEHHVGARSWPESDTIEHFVLKRRFDAADSDDFVTHFPPRFRAARLQEISGIEIEQTYYLDQHLRFDEDSRTVKIFMDIPWLQAMVEHFRAITESLEVPDDIVPPGDSDEHRDPPAADEQEPAQLGVQMHNLDPQAGNATREQAHNVASPAGTMVADEAPNIASPADAATTERAIRNQRKAATALLPIFEEALRTLDILFPDWDPKTIAFVHAFRDEGEEVPWFKLEHMSAQMQQGLNRFKFWRSRLNELIIEHQSPPQDWRHIWNDRRNPMTFWTFWIGMAIFLLTLVFGTVASVLAGLTLGRPVA